MKWNGIEKNWNKFLSFEWIGTLTFLFLFLTTLTFETQGLSSNSTCVSKKSCGECIRSPDCVWCSQPEFMNAANVPLDRCNTRTVHATHPKSIRCGASFLLSPKNEFNLTEDLGISKGSEYSQVVQIRPQRVSLKLRVGQAFDLNVLYAQMEDQSMEDDKKITSSVEMKDTASEYIRVSYFSKCVGSNKNMIETNKCNGLRVGTVVEFLVKIKVTRCPKNQNDWNQEFVIYQVGLHERVQIDLEMLCECGCEKPETWDYQLNLNYCKGTGTYKCGICECNENYFGRRCECSAKHGFTIDDDRACRLDITKDIVCSNRGQCICGHCECEKRDMDDDQEISGTYCQCDNFSCERENGKLCSGRDHGVCECGKCICNRGWNGKACACSTDKRTCTDPISRKICNGKGECVCGRCVCANTLTESYSGEFCEKCPNCPDRCEELLDCVQCTVWKSGNFPNEEDCTSDCTKYPEIVQLDLVNSEENNDKFCSATDAKDKCRFYYVYGYNSNRELYIKADRTKDCPPEPPIFLIIFGVSATVLVLILFLVVWV